ncbi:hypothetical protein HLV40_13435 [Chromohalobacter salexigens]|nr:hypothetical protein [Chromohalobacter salexigens]
MKVKEIAKVLKIPEWAAAGKARAGLFGYASKSGNHDRKLVENYQQYGTQWVSRKSARYTPEEIDVTVPGWENPPLGTLRQYRIGLGDQWDTPDKDACWLAHYYFVPNHFYFPDRQMLAPIGKPLVKLHKKFHTTADGCDIGVYPDPDGDLALITVLGKKDGDQDYLTKGLKIINPLLNWLTFSTDQALPIVQQFWIGLPSGMIEYQKQVEPSKIQLSPAHFIEHDPLIHAQSLYRRALNCNDPIYAFFSFWRAAEAVDEARNQWCRETRISLIRVKEEIIPKHNVFGTYSGKKFTWVMDKLRDEYRNAIAHVSTYKSVGKVLTGSHAEDENSLKANTACIRYIAKTKIDNFHATLNAQVNNS